MKGIITIGGKLAVICAVAATLLGFVNAATEPVIKENKIKALHAALQKVAPEGTIGEETAVEKDPVVKACYEVTDNNSKTTGYVLRLNGIGYGGDMAILSYYGVQGDIRGVILMDNQETPGLGKKAEKPEYMEKFLGTGGDNGDIPVKKSQLPRAQADAITGASVTFMGLAKALKAGSVYVQSR